MDMNTEAIIDKGALNTLHAIGGNSFVIEMIDVFSDFYLKIVTEARAGLVSGNMEPIIRMGHTLQSSCRNLGAMELASLAARIEAAARGTMVTQLPALLDESDRTFARTKAALDSEKKRRQDTIT